MEIEKFLELTQGLEKKKKAKKEDLERFKRFFERFHNLNRAYLDGEINRLRNKRMKLPLENVELGEMQKVQNKDEMLIKEFLAELPK